MKKILFLLLAVACVSQLKAQQLITKPGGQLLLKAPNDELNQLKLKDSILLKDFSIMPEGQLLAVAPGRLPGNNLSFVNPAANIDRMPVAKMNGNIDRMPIAKVSGNIDKMPVVKVDPLGLPKPVIP